MKENLAAHSREGALKRTHNLSFMANSRPSRLKQQTDGPTFGAAVRVRASWGLIRSPTRHPVSVMIFGLSRLRKGGLHEEAMLARLHVGIG
jgi:hypothetical protein